jgi:hypothetical protein
VLTTSVVGYILLAVYIKNERDELEENHIYQLHNFPPSCGTANSKEFLLRAYRKRTAKNNNSQRFI